MCSCSTQNLFMEKKSERKKEIFVLDSVFHYNANYQYRIRNNDKISISVWAQEDLSVGSVYGIYDSNEAYGKWLMVDANGNIEVPKLGTMNVYNRTIIELKDTLKNLLTSYLTQPIVDIKVLNKEITILGEVRDPQVIIIHKDQNTLLEMIARCKGFEFYANLKYIKVLRQDGPHVKIANINLTSTGNYLEKNIQLLPNDIVIVPSKKHKNFDKRVSNIIPFTSTITAAALVIGLL